MNNIPDELVEQVLADPNSRQMLSELLKANNITDPIDTLPPETKKAAVAALLQASQQNQGPPPEATPELLAQLLQDPGTLSNINAMLTNSGISTPFEQMEETEQLEILTQILAQQQQAKSNGGVQVNLAALQIEKEEFDQIWESAQTEGKGDVSAFASTLKAKLQARGAPPEAIEELLSQFPH